MKITTELTVVVERSDGTRTVLGTEDVHVAGDNTGFESHEIARAIASVTQAFTVEHPTVLNPAPGSEAWARENQLLGPKDDSSNAPPAWLVDTSAWQRRHHPLPA